MRRMSFGYTESQLLDGRKSVTRRLGWAFLRPGDRLMAVRRAMGLRKGDRQVVLAEIEVTRVTRERLCCIRTVEVAREGFPGWTPTQFIEFYCRAFRCPADQMVTRIEFRRL